MHELCYTEAPKGLFPGSAGFCTVKATAGMPLALRKKLESLSWYDRKVSDQNFPRFAFSRHHESGTEWSILTQVSPTIGHSKRASVFAHHIALDANDPRNSNPAFLLAGGLLQSSWDGKVEEIPQRNGLHSNIPSEATGTTWQRIKGDADFAHYVAAHLRDKREPVVIAWNDASPLLQLIGESVGLLPSALQWQITFSTQYASASDGSACRIRCIKHEKKTVNDMLRSNSLVVDLTSREATPAGATAARHSFSASSPGAGVGDTGFGAGPQSGLGAAAGQNWAASSSPLLEEENDGIGYGLQPAATGFGDSKASPSKRSKKQRGSAGKKRNPPPATHDAGSNLLDQNNAPSKFPVPPPADQISTGINTHQVGRGGGSGWALFVPLGAVIGAILAVAICVPVILSFKSSAEREAAKFVAQESEFAQFRTDTEKAARKAEDAQKQIELQMRGLNENKGDLSTDLQSSRELATGLKKSLAELQGRLLKSGGSKHQAESEKNPQATAKEVDKVLAQLDSLMASTGKKSIVEVEAGIAALRALNEEHKNSSQKATQLSAEIKKLQDFKDSVESYVHDVSTEQAFTLPTLNGIEPDENKKIILPGANEWRLLIGGMPISKAKANLELVMPKAKGEDGEEKAAPHLQIVEVENDDQVAANLVRNLKIEKETIARIQFKAQPVPTVEFSHVARVLDAEYRGKFQKAIDGMKLTLTPADESEKPVVITFKVKK